MPLVLFNIIVLLILKKKNVELKPYSILGKLFDNVILQNKKSILNTSDLQFGFKTECSTTYHTFVLGELIQYYKNNKTDVYVMMLDVSKAFDRVEYVKLFSLFLKRGLCPVICRLLIYMYTNQSLCVKWDTEIFKQFSAQNGVKQGGILSPIMFIVYMDVLLLNLKKIWDATLKIYSWVH